MCLLWNCDEVENALMKHVTKLINGDEPALRQRDKPSGMEPALSRNFPSQYGRFRILGLEAPGNLWRRRPRVVLAHADQRMSELLSLLADSNGYDMTATDNAVDCLYQVQELQPDLVVTGFRLKGMATLNLIKQIRDDTLKTVRDVPILVMDGQSDQQAILEAFSAGADDYLELQGDMSAMLRYWRRVATRHLQPAPLTAIQSENRKVQQAATIYLINHRPEGLVQGLHDLLALPDGRIRLAIGSLLAHLEMEDAMAFWNDTEGVPALHIPD